MSVDPSAASSNRFADIKAPNWGEGATSAAPTPQNFRDLHLSEELLKALDEMGYEVPTPVQSSTAPLILAGLDLIVQSQTGTGKTAAFAIPTVELLEAGTEQVEALILAPTRELAKQVGGEYERLGKFKGVPVACVYGGTGFAQQLEDLKTAQVVCATPGRLLDLLKRKAMTLDNLKVFILDEADEMLNMGFEKELTAIVERLPPTRQSLLFSATVDEDIKRLSSHILTYPEFVTLSSDQVAAEEVQHVYYMVTGMGRLWDLTRIIEAESPESAIVFCNTREDSFLVANFLKKQGYTAEVLNGDLPQKEREATLSKLRAGQIQFLVATDVAARGIDISDLSHVLNYTLPDSPETYIHRTGRTGRAGKQGVAISLISPREIGTYYILRRVYKMILDERELPTPEDLVLIRQKRAVSSLFERLDAELDSGDHSSMAAKILASPEAAQYIAKLLASFERAVGGFEEAPEVEDEDVVDEAALRAGGAAARAAAASAPVVPAPAPVVEPAKPEPAVVAEPEPTKVEEPVAAAEPEAPVADVAAEPEVQEAAVEEPSQAEPAQEEAPRRRRRPRRRPEESAEVAAEPQDAAAEPEVQEAAAEEPAQEEAPRRRRRRRRRGGDAEEAAAETQEAAAEPEEAAVEEPAQEEPAQEEAPRRRRRRRRRSEDVIEETEPPARGVEVIAGELSDEAILAQMTDSKDMTAFVVNFGSKRFGSDEDIINALCDLAGMEPDDFGAVKRNGVRSQVQARHDMVQDIIEAIDGQDFDGMTIEASLA